MKRVLLFGLVSVFTAFAVLATPASAQIAVKESSCTETKGGNTMTYDCGFNVRDYVLGAPVTFTINWSCTGKCGAVTSFGLRQSGFSPSGVSGHLMGARRTTNGLDLTFAFDSLKKAGNGMTGNGHFKMTVQMDDGSGTYTDMPCDINVHLK